MFACQLESILAVIEGPPETVHSVMAGPAVCPVVLRVLLHESRVDLGMAHITHRRIEMGKTRAVTVFAGESRAISHFLVACKRKTHREVWKLLQVQDC